jgi:hypothetical protein
MLYDIDDKIQLNLSLPKHARDMLRKMAGKRMMDDPSKVESAASVGAEIIREYLEGQDKDENKEKKEESQ